MTDLLTCNPTNVDPEINHASDDLAESYNEGNDITAKLFVTTYATGNRLGFGVGKWFNLRNFANRDAFLAAATEYAKNELCDFDPELCVSDIESDNSFVHVLHKIDDAHEDIWSLLALSEHDADLVTAYVDCFGRNGFDVNELLEKASDKFVGCYDSNVHFAEQMANELDDLDDVPDYIQDAIDWYKVAGDVMQDYRTSNGFYFRAY